MLLQLLWNGRDAFQAALETVAAAERASQQDEAQLGHGLQQFVWRQDMLRLATDSKQVLQKHIGDVQSQTGYQAHLAC